MTRKKLNITKPDKESRKRRKRNLVKKIMSFLFNVWVCARIILDHGIDYVFGLIYNSRRLYMPKTKDKLILESASSLARKIRDRNVKVEEVVCAYINRIKEVNHIVNAVVDNRFTEAIEEAKTIDRDIEDGKITKEDFEMKPFLGVPFTTKDTTACKGLSNTFGLLARKNFKGKEDSDVVAAMKCAGGILLGVTNVPQLNMWQETSNPVYGTTNNPYNTTRNVGGSSGGEASIIASCGSPIGIGSDIGGSIRIPCFMCGLFGHKTIPGLISTKGLTYRTGKEKETMVVAGPMTRYAEDIVPLFKVLLGDNSRKLNLEEKVDVTRLNMYFIEDPGDPFCCAPRDEMRQIFTKTVQHFASILDDTPEKVKFEGTRYGGKLWRYWMSQENSNFKSEILDKKGEVNTFTEIFKFITRSSDFNAAVVLVLLNDFIPKENEEWARQLTKTLKNEIIELLGENGVLLYPSAPWPASYHYTAFFRPWNFNYFAIWNALKLPVTQVPLGLSKDGLPLGIQVISAPYQDRLCIAVAKELEKVFGGYTPPFEVET